MDGNMWCAVGPGFQNLAISKAGFSTTKVGAVANLNGLHHRVSDKRSVDEFEVGGFCSQCTEWVEEMASMDGYRDFHCPCQ